MEIGLVSHVEKFLIEMGAGFAFMGRQYHIEVSGDEYYIDILMYNTFLHRYLVIELKDTEFMPEYIGKLNFYCSAVGDILCREGDNRTIGLLLCKTKGRIKAEYALRDIHCLRLRKSKTNLRQNNPDIQQKCRRKWVSGGSR